MKTSQEIIKTFVRRLKDYMKENSLNISQFARQVDIPARTINGWMLNERIARIDYIYHIAEYLNCSIDYLVGKEDL